MEEIIQKRKLILQNENKLFSKISKNCLESCYLKTYNCKNGEIKEYFTNNIFVYMYKESAILSPTKLNKITENDFGEEEFFVENINCIGYNTKIESGFWVLFKNNEVRYTLKNISKKIAVIQIKKNNEYSIEQNIFSYSSKIEKEINKYLKISENIMSVLLHVIEKNDVQQEIGEIQEDLNGKSLKLVINEFKLAINQMEENENQKCLNEKLLIAQQKYQKILIQLKTEKENMKLNVNKEAIPVNRALTIIKKENSFIKTVKQAWIAVEKILNSNIYIGEKNSKKYGG